MHISFTFKNFEPSEHLRKYARRRMEKLGRFFGKNPALDAQVNMAVDKFRQRVEVQLTGDGINIAASEVSEDMYASIDLRFLISWKLRSRSSFPVIMKSIVRDALTISMIYTF